MATPAVRHQLSAVMLATVVAALAGVSSARFIVEKNTVKVLSPPSIRGDYEAAIANYGIPSYGGTMTGVVVYPDKAQTACAPFSTTFKSKSKRPVVLVVNRGDCYFALKTWNAQLAGAAAVLVADNVDEPLLTMDTPDESADTTYLDNITIPSALITRSFGNALKSEFSNSGGSEVVVKLDWRESMPHPDERVEYEFWTNSNDECGPRCDEQLEFVSSFKGHAQLLERGGFTLFTPHYITWFCPEAFTKSKQCQSQCINAGRYCAPDPEQDFDAGYSGRDIVIENLRALCVHRVANLSGRPWVWWDYVVDYHLRCSMKANNYSKDCAQNVVRDLGIQMDEMTKCMGDPDADTDNDVLMTEQAVQVGHGDRGDVTILPTLVINNIQYRGKLEHTAVLQAICAGFKESTEPRVCLAPDLETNECLDNNGGCWHDKNSNATACKDTYRGRVCECPSVNGIQYQGDGYTSCTAVGPGRCAVNNGGCWNETRDGKYFSACSESDLHACRCPEGFQGNGFICEDVNECAQRTACTCSECSCKNTWGSFECTCQGNLVYIAGEDTCIAKNMSKFGWLVAMMVLGSLAAVGIAGYLFYKYRLRSYMDSEIMAIMSQYMPLDNQNRQVFSLEEETGA